MRNIIPCMRSAAVVALVVLGFSANAATFSGKSDGVNYTINYSTSTTIPVGEWTEQFTEAKAKADAENIPMLVFWGNGGCGWCARLEATMARPEFVSWMKERGYIFTFNVSTSKFGTGTEDQAEAKASKSFALAGADYPFIAYYWKSNTKGEKVYRKRTLHGSVDHAKTAKEFMADIDKYFAGYEADKGAKFDLENPSAGNRYEAEPTTETVSIRLKRSASASASAGETSWTLKKGTVQKASGKFTWKAGESAYSLPISVKGLLTKAGETLTVTLDGKASTTITCVNDPNSAANPDVGDTYQKGRWTMNLDAAKAWAKSNGGYVLVSVQGSLWCPDCANTDRNFLDEADGTFKNWANDNNIALVSMDIPKFNSHGSADGTLTTFEKTTAKTPTLLSRAGMETTLARNTTAENPELTGAPTDLTKPLFRSGLGFMSRKNLSDEQAEKWLKRNWEFVTTDVAAGGCHQIGDSWLNRTGVPIFVLLLPDGTVKARFTRFADKSPFQKDAKGNNIAKAAAKNYIKRFDEMLAIAKGTTADDKSEIANNGLSAKSIALEANDGTAQGRLCNADPRDSFLLKNFSGNAKEKITVTGDTDAEVRVSLVSPNRMKKEAFNNGANNRWQYNPYASATGKLSAGVTVEYDFTETGTFYVLVEPKDATSPAFAADSSKDSNFHAFTVTGSTVLKPTSREATATAPSTSDKVSIHLEKGVTYRLTGLKAGAEPSTLSKKSGAANIYTYNGTTGTVDLTLTANHGSITYQKWTPGVVGFVPDYWQLPAKATTEKRVTIERKESDEVEIQFNRTQGFSGAITVEVALNLEKSTFFYDYADDPAAGKKTIPRFTVDDKLDFMTAKGNVVKTLNWADGDSGSGKIKLAMRSTETQDVQDFFGNGQVVFDIRVTKQAESGETKVQDGTFTVQYVENQKASPGYVAIAGADRDYAKKLTVYARKSDTVKLRLERVKAWDNPAWAELNANVKGIKLSCDNKSWFRDGNLVGWDNHDRTARTVSVSGLPEPGKSVKLTLKPATSGFKALSGSNTVTIVSIADDAPEFVEAEKTLTVYRYVAVPEKDRVLEVTGAQGGTLSVAKLSGALPSGLSVKVEGGKVVLTGTVSSSIKNGQADYVAYYQVTERNRPLAGGGKKTVAGGVVKIVVKAIDETAEGTDAKGKGALNDSCKKSRTFKNLIFIDPASQSLAGTMQLTLPARGNASAKYTCAVGTISFSTKGWDALDTKSGTLHATLSATKKDYADYYVEVMALPNGAVTAELTTKSGGYVAAVDGLWSQGNYGTASAYQGYYTVSLCDGKVREEHCEGYAPRGAGYLTLKMTSSSQFKTGTMTWALVLPNGTTASGSAQLSKDEMKDLSGSFVECVWLPVFKQTKTDVFASVVQIAKDAKAKAEDPQTSCHRAVTAPTVYDGEGVKRFDVLTYWDHAETAPKNGEGAYLIAYDLRGSYYDATLKKLLLDCCCEEFHGTTEMMLSVTYPGDSETYGKVGPVTGVPVTVGQNSIALKKGLSKAENPQGVKLSFSKSTGVVSGSFKLPYVDKATGREKTLSATYKGVVVIGWGDGGSCSACGEGNKWLPFVNGSWYFTDKAGYEVKSSKGVTRKTMSVKRGALVKIEAPEEK